MHKSIKIESLITSTTVTLNVGVIGSLHKTGTSSKPSLMSTMRLFNAFMLENENNKKEKKLAMQLPGYSWKTVSTLRWGGVINDPSNNVT